MGKRGGSSGRPGWGAGQRGRRGAYDSGTRRAAQRFDAPSESDSGASRESQRSAASRDAERRYPWQEDPDYDGRSGPLPPLPEDHPGREQDDAGPAPEPEPEPDPDPGEPRGPKKITVTRVVGWRSKDLTQRAMRLFFSLAHADGADRSGLAKFTYAVMGNYAVDAAMAVALANTLFFSAATAESRDKVALYLLITMAPFAVIAPVIGPALDRLQQGRRAALGASFGIRVVLAAVMALNFDSWLLYPAALGCMVLSKSFTVLRSAMTPRVLPEQITLTKANSRLTAFGLAAGGVLGGIASGVAWVAGSEGALWFMAALAAGGVWLCARIPGWVESTEGELRTALNPQPRQSRKIALSGHVVVALWGNGGIRVLTGFLTLFAAFVIKHNTQHEPQMQLVLLGLVGGAAGCGSFLGNAIGSRMHFDKPDRTIISCLSAVLAVVVCAAVLAGLPLAVALGLVGATASALAKVCLDAVIQRDMPEASRASAFGRSETVLQLSWVFGGALGVLLPPVYWIGFTVVAVLLALVLVQTILRGQGSGLLPAMPRRAPASARSHAGS